MSWRTTKRFRRLKSTEFSKKFVSNRVNFQLTGLVGKNFLPKEQVDLKDKASKQKFLKVVKSRTTQMSAFQLTEFIKVSWLGIRIQSLVALKHVSIRESDTTRKTLNFSKVRNWADKEDSDINTWRYGPVSGGLCDAWSWKQAVSILNQGRNKSPWSRALIIFIVCSNLWLRKSYQRKTTFLDLEKMVFSWLTRFCTVSWWEISGRANSTLK